MRKTSIKNRLLLYLLGIPLAALVFIFGFALFNMTELKDFAAETGSSLGDDAIDSSAEALTLESKDGLKMLAAGQAMISNIQLRRLTTELNNIVGLYLELYTETPPAVNMQSAPDENIMKDELASLAVAGGVDKTKVKPDITLALRLSNALKFLYVHNNYSQGIGIASASGTYFKYGRNPVPENFDSRERPWFTGAVASPGKDVWTGPVASVIGGRVVITCSRAVFLNGKLLGVVVIDVSPEAVAEDFSVTRGTNGYAFLLNSKGRLVAQEGIKDKQLRWEIESPADKQFNRELALAMTAGERGLKTIEHHGEKLEVAYAPVEINGWSVGVAVPENSIIAAARLTREKIKNDIASYQDVLSRDIRKKGELYLGMAAGMLLLIFGLCVWLSRWICVPVKQLTAGAEKLGQGALDVRIDLNTGDELEDLADSFNVMAGNLEKHIAEFKLNLEQKEQMERKMAVAAEIQRAMLPRIFPAFPDKKGIEIYAFMEPAKEVGGDFYDYFFIDDQHLFFAIGDVSGKGLPAAIFMARALTLLRYEAVTDASPSVMLANTGNALEKNNASCMFATVFCGILDIASGQLVFANAGHNPPLTGNEKSFEFMELNKGIVVGPMELQEASFTVQHSVLLAGDTLFLYTDGVNEAFNEQNEAFGNDRLKAVLDANRGAEPEALINAVSGAVTAFAGQAPQSDDITLLALKFTGEKS